MAARTSAYDVLGVTSTASDEDLRRAYRRALRRTHPDTGGVAAEFHAVQAAWEQVGTADARARYDRSAAAPAAPFARGQRTQRAKQPRSATPYTVGQPGRWWHLQYVQATRAWAETHVTGGVAASFDPYDQSAVASVPSEIRQMLAAARTEEATAHALATVGSDFTVWHDVSTDVDGGNPEEKLDHIVLGPTGLFALLSEDRQSQMFVRGGEVTGDGFGWRERPIRTLTARARFFSENIGVRFTGVVMVVPDDAGINAPTIISRIRGLSAVIVNRSQLSGFLVHGLPGETRLPAHVLQAALAHLQRGVQLV